jgi:hypothetical protein
VISSVVTLSLTTALVLGGMLLAKADPQTRTDMHFEERIIIHVLNRLGYGPRPGDITHVKRLR